MCKPNNNPMYKYTLRIFTVCLVLISQGIKNRLLMQNSILIRDEISDKDNSVRGSKDTYRHCQALCLTPACFCDTKTGALPVSAASPCLFFIGLHEVCIFMCAVLI